MTNIASALKEEITRLARKELKAETELLKKASARYRSDIAALKRQTTALEQQIARLEKLLAKSAPAARSQEPDQHLRFRADGFKKHRERLGLSAAAMGSLAGVSAQTIYNWEAGTTRPSKAQIVKIAALRKMGKREVQEHLARLA